MSVGTEFAGTIKACSGVLQLKIKLRSDITRFSACTNNRDSQILELAANNWSLFCRYMHEICLTFLLILAYKHLLCFYLRSQAKSANLPS